MRDGKKAQGREGLRKHILLRLFCAVCVSVAVLLTILLALAAYANPFVASVLFHGDYNAAGFGQSLSDPSDSQESPVDAGVVWTVLGAAAFIAFVLALVMEYGSPSGGSVRLADVFENRSRLFWSIGGGRFRLRDVLLLALTLCVLCALFGTLSEYLYFRGSLGFLEGLDPAGHMAASMPHPSIYTWAFKFLSLSIQSLLSFIAAPFLLYWLVRAFGGRACYLNLLALTVYLSVVPAAFVVSGSLSGLLFYLLGRLPLLSMEFFPYLGAFLFMFLLARGVGDITGLSMWKAVIVVSPLIFYTFVSVYLRYVLIYLVPERLFAVILWQLGVYAV